MIRLRVAAKVDLEKLFDLDRICFPAGTAYSRREFPSLLASSRTVSVVAEEDGVLAGFVIAQGVRVRASFGGHIATIDVAPPFRRRGIGRLLMMQLEAQMLAANACWLRLEVAVDNAAALDFYSGFGFEPVGQIPGYYQDNLDALVMEMALPRVSTFIP